MWDVSCMTYVRCVMYDITLLVYDRCVMYEKCNVIHDSVIIYGTVIYDITFDVMHITWWYTVIYHVIYHRSQMWYMTSHMSDMTVSCITSHCDTWVTSCTMYVRCVMYDVCEMCDVKHHTASTWQCHVSHHTVIHEWHHVWRMWDVWCTTSHCSYTTDVSRIKSMTVSYMTLSYMTSHWHTCYNICEICHVLHHTGIHVITYVRSVMYDITLLIYNKWVNMTSHSHTCKTSCMTCLGTMI